jgi:hypothetical protein
VQLSRIKSILEPPVSVLKGEPMTRITGFDRQTDTFVSLISCVRTEDLDAAAVDGLRWWDRFQPGHSITRENMLPLRASETGTGEVTHWLCYLPDVPWEMAEDYAAQAEEWGTLAVIEFGHLSEFLARKRLVLFDQKDIDWAEMREQQNTARLEHERRINAKTAHEKRADRESRKQTRRKAKQQRQQSPEQEAT